MQRWPKDGTARDKTQIISGPGDVSLQIFNNDSEKRYVQIFDIASADSVVLGTTVAKSVMVLPGSGGNTWDASWRTHVEQGMVIAVTTTRDGSTLATAAADYSARY